MMARDRLGMEQTAQYTFLHALGHRPEQRIDGVVVSIPIGRMAFSE